MRTAEIKIGEHYGVGTPNYWQYTHEVEVTDLGSEVELWNKLHGGKGIQSRIARLDERKGYAIVRSVKTDKLSIMNVRSIVAPWSLIQAQLAAKREADAERAERYAADEAEMQALIERANEILGFEVFTLRPHDGHRYPAYVDYGLTPRHVLAAIIAQGGDE